ncbi:MAG: hypothetical protein EA379_04010 [Phycisphaerales bacterium]|nr:MAG: hypothetical protein EA379_04010 [Phycisphaerales bacterium]
MNIKPTTQELPPLLIDPQAAKAAAAPLQARGAARAAEAPSKADIVDFSPAAISPKQGAPVSEVALKAQNERPVAQTPPSEAALAADAAPQPAVAQTFTQADLDAAIAAMGATTGQEHFNAKLDINGDGVIDFNDLTHILANMQPQQPPEPVFGMNDLQGLIGAYGAAKGDNNFNPAWDLNGDGLIDFNDLSAMLASFEAPVAANTATQLDAMLQAFGSAKGDANYDEALDLTGSGSIGFADLSALLRELLAGD